MKLARIKDNPIAKKNTRLENTRHPDTKSTGFPAWTSFGRCERKWRKSNGWCQESRDPARCREKPTDSQKSTWKM